MPYCSLIELLIIKHISSHARLVLYRSNKVQEDNSLKVGIDPYRYINKNANTNVYSNTTIQWELFKEINT